MWGLVAAAVAVVLSAAGWLWYNAKRVANAETSSASDQALREAAEKRAAELEAQRLAAAAAERLKDVNEGTEVVESGDRKRAVGFVLDSFEDNHDSN